MSHFLALLVSGIAYGAVVALAAIGFLVLYKATGIVNFAHGDLITCGAIVAIWAIDDLDLPVLVGYAVALVLLFALGVVLETITLRPLRGRSTIVVVIATLGAALVIRAALSLWRGSSPSRLASPVGGGAFDIGGVIVSYQRILIIVGALAAVLALIAVFQRTSFGRRLRTLAADRDMANLLGIRVRRMSMLSFGLSALLACLAGLLIGPLGAVDLTLGFNIMLAAFAAAVLGGFGSLSGVVVGGFLIGIVQQTVGGYILRDYRDVLPYGLMLLVIAIRPGGLFSSEGSHARL